MNKLYIITAIVSIAIITFILYYAVSKAKQVDLLSFPQNISMKTFESYIFRNSRTKKLQISSYPLLSVYLIPKFITTYFKSTYYDICDLLENSITAIYLTTIGNINFSSRILHSIIYIMLNNGWNPSPKDSTSRIKTFTGIPRFYNINITSDGISGKQWISDISSLYAIIALCKFILTFDSILKPNKNYSKIVKLYTNAAYDLWNYIYTTQRCLTDTTCFYAFKLGSSSTTSIQLTSSFHILMYASCAFISLINQTYNMGITQASVEAVKGLCNTFLIKAISGDTIQYLFNNCSLPVGNTYPQWGQNVTEDYLNLLLLGYYPVSSISPNILSDKILSTMYVPDTDDTPVGCGPGIYNIECKDTTQPASNCYNITCSPQYVSKDRLFYGMKWSTLGRGISFAMSAFTFLTLCLTNQTSSNNQELQNIKNSIIKIYDEYNETGILGGFQEETAFLTDPLNTGTEQSIFRYLSLLASMYCAFMFLYLQEKDTAINFLIPNTKIFPITISTLGFDDSPIYSVL